jgi:hypothetical protein
MVWIPKYRKKKALRGVEKNSLGQVSRTPHLKRSVRFWKGITETVWMAPKSMFGSRKTVPVTLGAQDVRNASAQYSTDSEHSYAYAAYVVLIGL